MARLTPYSSPAKTGYGDVRLRDITDVRLRLQRLFGEHWHEMHPSEMVASMAMWCDGDGQLGETVSLSRSSLMAVAVYAALYEEDDG